MEELDCCNSWKVKMKLNKTTERMAWEDPKKGIDCRSKEGEKEEHLSHYKTLIFLAKLHALKEQLWKQGKIKLINLFKWMILVKPCYAKEDRPWK